MSSYWDFKHKKRQIINNLLKRHGYDLIRIENQRKKSSQSPFLHALGVFMENCFIAYIFFAPIFLVLNHYITIYPFIVFSLAYFTYGILDTKKQLRKKLDNHELNRKKVAEDALNKLFLGGERIDMMVLNQEVEIPQGKLDKYAWNTFFKQGISNFVIHHIFARI